MTVPPEPPTHDQPYAPYQPPYQTQPYGYPPQQPYQTPAPAAQVARVNRRNWLILGGVIAAGLVAIVVAAVAAPAPARKLTADPATASSPIYGGDWTPHQYTAESPSPRPVIMPSTQAPPPPPPSPFPPLITSGTWIVGEDFPPGTYETTTDDNSCYWDITKSGSNHRDYVDQQLGVGHWRVALKQGEDFTTKECGVWKKIG